MCYGCDILGHTSYQCKQEVIISEAKPKIRMYGPWIVGALHNIIISSTKVGSISSQDKPREAVQRSWRDIVSEVRDLTKRDKQTSKNHNKP